MASNPCARRIRLLVLKIILRSALCFVLLLLGTPGGHGDESFHVIAADSQRQQVLNVRVDLDSNGAILTQNESLPLAFHATSIALDPVSQRMVVSAAALDDQQQATAATIQMDASGELILAAEASLPTPTGYTSVDRNGRYFLTANYPTGDVAVYRLDHDGRVGDQVCLIQTPHTAAHCILTTPDNRFAYVPCVKKNNALFQYRFDETSGQLTALDPIDALPPVMFGPRHMVYHPTLPMAYFSNEQQLGVSAYGIGESGKLRAIQHATTMQRRTPFVQGKRDLHASDIVITDDGKRLFVAVRDFGGDEDSVFAFRIGADGRLSSLARTLVGDIPWKLGLSPRGGHLLVSAAFDRRLSILRIEPDGRLVRLSRMDWGAEVRDMVVVDAQRTLQRRQHR